MNQRKNISSALSDAPKNRRECEVRRLELVELIMGLENKIAQREQDEEDDDYQEWLKRTKKLILRSRFEIARLNKLKAEFLDKEQKEKELTSKQNTAPQGNEASNSLIKKAFGMLCNDVIANNVPALNSAKAIASYYFAMAGLPEGNRAAVIANVIDDEEDSDIVA